MADCTHLARTSAYFDGALPEAEHAQVLAHLETCAACQQHLQDAVTFDAVLSQATSRTRRWWPIAAVATAAAAAAAVVLWIALPAARPKPPRPDELAIELPVSRAVEGRFSGPRFSAYRPLDRLRGDQVHERISLAALADLERRGETRDLVAALVATGDLPRARAVAATLPDDAAGASDRAALELAAGDDDQALRFAYRAVDRSVDRDPAPASGWWNLALAATHRGLLHVAHDALAKVVARGEVGWVDEARAQLAVIDRDLDRAGAGFTAFTQRGAAMVQGGPVISLDDVRAFPTYARLYLLDALRTGSALDAIRPLATELDRLTATTAMTRAVERVAAAAPAVRARFVDGYRKVVARTAAPAEVTDLLTRLRAAGPAVDDVRAGTIILSGQTRTAELAAVVAPWQDPWFDLYVAREQVRVRWPVEDVRAEAPLVAALGGCANDAWALRCGQLANDLAERYVVWGRDQDAERWAAFATQRHTVAGSPNLPAARALLADIHRHLGRTALARAELDEVVQTAPTCDQRRFAQIGLANDALVEDRWAAVREALPPAHPGEGCSEAPDILGIATAVELARHTGAAADVARARDWIDGSRDLVSGGIAAVGTLRISRGADREATAAVERWLAAPRATDPNVAAVRTWAATTLISDAGARGDWANVIASAALDHAAPAGPCTVVASFDDGVLTVAVRTDRALLGDQRTLPQTELASAQIVPTPLAQALAGCAVIAVVARPPLHGRSDLLPVALPWAFAGDRAPQAVAGGAPLGLDGRGTPDGSAAEGRRGSIDVSDARPPDPTLPRLSAAPAGAAFEISLTGTQATPSRVLGALAGATYAELHVHGIAAAANDDATYLALSPDPDGQFALRAAAVRTARLARAPVIVLAACRAAAVAPYLRQRWSLPDAFLAAGASAVVAADVAIPDGSARRVFDELHRRIAGGEPIEHAVAAIRAAASGDTAWAAHLMLFR